MTGDDGGIVAAADEASVLGSHYSTASSFSLSHRVAARTLPLQTTIPLHPPISFSDNLALLPALSLWAPRR
jgi:hypothetical protein